QSPDLAQRRAQRPPPPPPPPPPRGQPPAPRLSPPPPPPGANHCPPPPPLREHPFALPPPPRPPPPPDPHAGHPQPLRAGPPPASPSPLTSGAIDVASFFPSSTPHWSNALIPHTTLCVNTLCSYSATSAPSVAGSTLRNSTMLFGRFPSCTLCGLSEGCPNAN